MYTVFRISLILLLHVLKTFLETVFISRSHNMTTIISLNTSEDYSIMNETNWSGRRTVYFDKSTLFQFLTWSPGILMHFCSGLHPLQINLCLGVWAKLPKDFDVLVILEFFPRNASFSAPNKYKSLGSNFNYYVIILLTLGFPTFSWQVMWIASTPCTSVLIPAVHTL